MRRRLFFGALASCVVPLPIQVPAPDPYREILAEGLITLEVAKQRLAWEEPWRSFEQRVLEEIAMSLGVPRIVLYADSPGPNYRSARLVTTKAECERLLGSRSWSFGEGSA